MHKTVARETPVPEQTIAITATFTAEPLEQPIKFWLEELEIGAEIQFAPFGQVFQELLDPSSLLNRNGNGLNVILIRPSDWQGAERQSMPDASHDPLASLRNNVAEFNTALRSACERSGAPFLVCLCHEASRWQSDLELSDRFDEILDKFNADIRDVPGAISVSAADIDSLYPVAAYYDAEQDKLASIPYNDRYYVSLATIIMRHFYSLSTPDTKVIALDCDNTLWKGICGEDGAHGVEVDFAARMLQEFMVSQHDKGVLLCLCSKNNEQDVDDVFRLRPDMPLGIEHLVSRRVNWKSKSENLASLSEELGLGLDSFVFIDDDPVECNEVHSRCPSVITLQLPRQRPMIPTFLKHAWVFDHLNITREARNRNALYRQNSMRKSVEASSTSLEEFLARLDLTINISEMKEENIARVAELFNRTNQFNATTIRYSENEVRSLFNTREKTVLVAKAKDRFGDYGLIGVTAYRIHAEQMDIDSLLMSCRALGRRIEHTLVARLAQIADAAGCKALNIQYVETTRNHLVHEFLESIGSGYAHCIPGGLEYRLPVDYMLKR